jgi:hypothetical protein
VLTVLRCIVKWSRPIYDSPYFGQGFRLDLPEQFATSVDGLRCPPQERGEEGVYRLSGTSGEG